MVKPKKYSIRVFFDELNSFDYLTEVLMDTLGYEVTQAANCASIIMDKGEYIVKSFTAQDKDIAEATIQLLTDNGIPATIVEIKK
jgi:ATP-dependent Clp protease adapter protein ClpS